MSNTDSFIEEVTEEVRRDKLFAMYRKYGWIAAVLVVLIVGGASFNEWRKAQAEQAAQAFGDAIFEALERPERPARIAALQEIAPPSAAGQAVLDMMIAGEQTADGQGAAAATTLQSVATNTEIPEIYRQIASFKALLNNADDATPAERRIALEAVAQPGSPIRLLAEEQLVLIDIEQGDRDAALGRLERIMQDAEVTQGLRRRAAQLIVALGGDVENAL